jgi:FdhE protein
VRESWVQRIRRAEELAADQGAAASLLAFYARLLQSQKKIYESCGDWQPSRFFERDLDSIVGNDADLLRTVAEAGPEPLAADAKALLETDRGAQRLREYWHDRSDRNFFGKAILQPYGQWLAEAESRTVPAAEAQPRCPRCGGAPQLAVLDAADGGGSRHLLCATCLTTWPFHRLVCAHCGEDDEKKLEYFQAPEFAHVRVDVCESCRHYIKTIDRTRHGLAIPLIDEVAASPLDLWARDRGYEKIELNLLGL